MLRTTKARRWWIGCGIGIAAFVFCISHAMMRCDSVSPPGISLAQPGADSGPTLAGGIGPGLPRKPALLLEAESSFRVATQNASPAGVLRSLYRILALSRAGGSEILAVPTRPDAYAQDASFSSEGAECLSEILYREGLDGTKILDMAAERGLWALASALSEHWKPTIDVRVAVDSNPIQAGTWEERAAVRTLLNSGGGDAAALARACEIDTSLDDEDWSEWLLGIGTETWDRIQGDDQVGRLLGLGLRRSAQGSEVGIAAGRLLGKYFGRHIGLVEENLKRQLMDEDGDGIPELIAGLLSSGEASARWVLALMESEERLRSYLHRALTRGGSGVIEGIRGRCLRLLCRIDQFEAAAAMIRYWWIDAKWFVPECDEILRLILSRGESVDRAGSACLALMNDRDLESRLSAPTRSVVRALASGPEMRVRAEALLALTSWPGLAAEVREQVIQEFRVTLTDGEASRLDVLLIRCLAHIVDVPEDVQDVLKKIARGENDIRALEAWRTMAVLDPVYVIRLARDELSANGVIATGHIAALGACRGAAVEARTLLGDAIQKSLLATDFTSIISAILALESDGELAISMACRALIRLREKSSSEERDDAVGGIVLLLRSRGWFYDPAASVAVELLLSEGALSPAAWRSLVRYPWGGV